MLLHYERSYLLAIPLDECFWVLAHAARFQNYNSLLQTFFRHKYHSNRLPILIYYLYIKTHNVTGLRYLGKTNSEDPYKYKGSGTYWRRHINIHGYNVTTDILLMTDNYEELKDTGLFFSKLFNIVESAGWANLMIEAGDGGNTQTERLKNGTHNFQNSEVQRKIQHNRILKGTHNLLAGNRTFTHGMTGRSHPTTRSRNLSDSNPFKNSIPCLDEFGSPCMIESNVYYAQLGDKCNWKYVHTKSKEARYRRESQPLLQTLFRIITIKYNRGKCN